MDNDLLIDQARQLYATLHGMQATLSSENTSGFERLERLISYAYCRYQRRLNRCALCYQHRNYDCIREAGKKRILCALRTPSNPVPPLELSFY